MVAHLLWLAAHYALGKLEVSQGFILSDADRSVFLKEYFEQHKDEFPLRENE